MIYVFLGIQGSGKGTQAAMLCQKMGFVHVNLGDLFRNHIAHQTEIGIEAASYISQGLLVPDEVVFKVIDDTFKKTKKSLILDGFPRNLHQAEHLIKHHKIKKVIYLELSDEIAMKRMLARRLCVSCGIDFNLLSKKPKKDGACDTCEKQLIKRADDNEEAIKNRLALFHAETQPLKEFFSKLGLLVVIDANASIEEVDKNILESLEL